MICIDCADGRWLVGEREREWREREHQRAHAFPSARCAGRPRASAHRAGGQLAKSLCIRAHALVGLRVHLSERRVRVLLRERVRVPVHT